jgi:hypothetical protein
MASNVVHVKLAEEDLGEFDFQKMTVFDTIQLKAKSGLSTKQFVDGLAEMDGQAMQALVWLLRTRQGATTELHAINFAIGDLVIEEAPDPTQAQTGDPASSGRNGTGTSASSSTSST